MDVCVRVSVCVPVCICILAPVCVLFTRLEGLAQWKSFLGALFSNWEKDHFMKVQYSEMWFLRNWAQRKQTGRSSEGETSFFLFSFWCPILRRSRECSVMRRRFPEAEFPVWFFGPICPSNSTKCPQPRSLPSLRKRAESSTPAALGAQRGPLAATASAQMTQAVPVASQYLLWRRPQILETVLLAFALGAMKTLPERNAQLEWLVREASSPLAIRRNQSRAL